MNLFKELQPVDRLTIRVPFPLSSYDRKLITLLYQPLIGAEPISLYFLLWAEGENIEDYSMSHYHLMNSLDLPIARIFESRIALEAIGLLRTWRKDEQETRSFIYDVMPPLDAAAFFDDPLLSMFLFSKIGETAYRNLRQRFVTKGLSNFGYQEVSRSFTDVYRPVSHNIPSDGIQLTGLQEKPKELPFHYEEFDFQLLRTSLSEQLVPSSILTAEIKATIAKLAFLYHLTPFDMQKVILLALDDGMNLSDLRLKKEAADYYKLTVSKEPPSMQPIAQKQEVFEHTPIIEEDLNPMEMELIRWFESSSPIDVLKDVAGGREPFPNDIQLVEDLVMQYEMSTPVVNVLIHYVFLRNHGKLNRKYIETIASHWRHTGVKTAREAMKLAREFEEQKSNDPKQQLPSEKKDYTKEYKVLKASAGAFYHLAHFVDKDFQNPAALKKEAITILEQASPKELLSMLVKGKTPFEKDVKVVEDFTAKYDDIKKPVMNTLIHYAYYVSNANLNSSFLQSIATNWRKNNVQSAEGAFKFAEDYQLQKNRKQYTPKNQPYNQKQNVPDWYYENKMKQQQKKEENKETTHTDYDKKRQEVMKKLGLKEGEVDS
ncbi:DnaD domain protein [Rummeliibacillus stabekisii]|uniref:DnaD domain protein n=1 Tax=Rummeliibacillus stabekisii TaxID=241244 RepID=UPI00203FD7D4|nr:DnaD domain protein [Rummeliibacillus stabekisii]MCM3316970.1 DnaD domain protein [Rummeliibacillus stabekisii]